MRAMSWERRPFMDVFDFFSKTSDDEWLMGLRTRDGCTVLHAAVKGEYYRLAVNILESYPKLADKRDEKGIKALDLLASKPLSFRSGSSYTLKNLGSMPFIPCQILGVLVYSCIPSMVIDSEIVGDVEDPRGSAHDISKSEGTLLSKLMSGTEGSSEVCCSYSSTISCSQFLEYSKI
ncbi:hypothetical protein ACSBR2_027453 [Camellia fascicularis]